MRGNVLSLFGLITALSLTCSAGELAGASKADPAALAANAETALNAWKYERAAEAIKKLARVAPQHEKLQLLRLRLAVRIGRFEDAAGLAAALPVETAGKIPVEEGLKAGRALAAAGKTKLARAWILFAARLAGASSPQRYMDSLIALVAPHGGQGLITRQFAAELASPVKLRLEAAKAYNLAAQALKGAASGKGAWCVQMASYAAQRRLAELSEGAIPEVPRSIRPHLALAWQAPVGVDDLPEHFALTPGVLLVASQPGGRALPGRPLSARLRAFDLKTGKMLWAHDFAPEKAPGADNSAPGARAAYRSRIDGLVAVDDRAYVLVKTSTVRWQGASKQLSESSASLLAIKVADGKTTWRNKVNSRSTRLYLAGEFVIAAGFRTLVGHAINDGRQKWDKEFPRSFSECAATTAKGLILPAWKEIICVNPATGEVAWAVKRPVGAGYVRSCMAGEGYFILGEKGTGTHGISSWGSAAGKRNWTRNFMASSTASDALSLALSGKTLVAARGAALRAVIADTGKNAWRAGLPLPPGAPRPQLLGAPGKVLWNSGSELALLAASSGSPLWWGSSVQETVQPIALTAGRRETTIYTLNGGSPRLITAWKVRDIASPVHAEMTAGANRLIAAAEKLARDGHRGAASSLLEITRNYAAPGVFEVDWAIFKLEMADDGRSESFEARGLLRAALAQAARGDARNKAQAFFKSVLANAPAPVDAGARSLAAAALMIFGDEAGAKHLAANPAGWTDNKARRKAVLAACRIAGVQSEDVLLAGLKSGEPQVRLALVERLAGLRGRKIEEALKARLTDEGREVRVAAATGLVSVLGKGAVEPLTDAYRREKNFFARNRMRALLTTLGANPDPLHRPDPMPRPHPTPRPTPRPTPQPSLTRAAALAKAAEHGKVLWNQDDPKDKLLLWISVGKKFIMLYNSSDGSLTEYGDFLKMVGRKDVTANGLAYGTDSIWAATSKGAFVFDRRTRAWSQLVINLDFDMLEAHVEKAEIQAGRLIFTVKAKGRFEQDLKTRKWSKL